MRFGTLYYLFKVSLHQRSLVDCSQKRTRFQVPSCIEKWCTFLTNEVCLRQSFVTTGLKGNWRQHFPLFLSRYIPLRLKNTEWANKRYIVQNQIFYNFFFWRLMNGYFENVPIQVTWCGTSHVCKAVKSVMLRLKKWQLRPRCPAADEIYERKRT